MCVCAYVCVYVYVCVWSALRTTLGAYMHVYVCVCVCVCVRAICFILMRWKDPMLRHVLVPHIMLEVACECMKEKKLYHAAK